jgi:arsenite-transporting ATPase
MSDPHVLHVFGGKGGTGKTTLSAAYALHIQESAPKEGVLLVSTAPSGALSELLKKKLSHKPTKLVAGKGEAGLYAAELDGATALKALWEKLKPSLQAPGQKGALLSEEDLGHLFAQVSPGLEELAALLQVLDYVEAKTFDRVVLDSAPTSHTLRLIDEPARLRKLLGVVRGGKPAGKKKEVSVPPAPAKAGPLEELVQRLERLSALLRDPARTAFHLVTLGEPVVEAQTRQLFAQLRERGVPVTEIVVNAIEEKDGCPACQGRRGLQAPHVRKYQSLDKNVAVQLVARREVAPRGLDGVKKLAKEWLESGGKESKALEFSAAEGPPALVRAPSMPPIAAPPLPPTRLIFFVGQGGVGKSSCAAAAAVTLTEKEGPVLLISTETSHSLSDVLQSRLTDTETQVKGTKGLYARELDVEGWLNAFRRRIKEKVERAFEGKPDAADREVLRNLLDYAPPGMDEFAAMSVLTDALVQERFKRIVVDPSPSLHTLRLLEVPAVAKAWLTELLGVLAKYKSKGLGELADDVQAMLKHVKRFEDALASPSESRFVVVTRGEELAAARTERLVEELLARKLQVERVLVNRVLPKSTCAKCENRRKLELTVAKALEKKVGLPITVAPALGRHPAGLRELKSFRTSWYALSEPAKTKAA